METAAGLFKLKPGKKEKLTHWQQKLNAEVNSVIASLEDEGVYTESWFVVRIADDDYLLWYMRAESMEKAAEAFQQSTRDIDQFHMEVLMDVVAENGRFDATPLLDFQRT